MSDFEDIQRLLRLKRYERPPDDFVEDFIRGFQHRQRQELLRHSARGLLWERVNTYFEGLFAPKWRWAGGTAFALLVAFMVFKPAASNPGGLAGPSPPVARPIDDKHAPISDAEVERYLISKHFEGGLGDEVRLIDAAQGPEPKMTPLPDRTQLPSFIRQDVDMKGQFQR
jgi:hypothetical protein